MGRYHSPSETDMLPTTCPTPAELDRLLQSGLSEHEASQLEEHVLHCDLCLAKLKVAIPANASANTTLADAMAAKDTLDDAAGHPLVVDLIRRLESSRPMPRAERGSVAKPVAKPGVAMITFACPSCQKKLSTKNELAGRKVKCPGCGQAVLVPAATHVPAGGEQQTMAHGSVSPISRAETTRQQSLASRSESPTSPSVNADNTRSHGQDEDHDTSLTEFLSPPQSDDELGRLGKYRILKILGHGGMGVVYQAEDPALKRRVALKAMLPSLGASTSARKRFMREAQSLAAVEHDHIARIYDVGEERGVSYLAMEFLKGEPLDQRLNREGKLPAREVVRIGREAAEGLAAAHANGLIHRDIKPGNLWIESPKNRVKILDFGLARAAEDAHLTQSGAIIGTPAYMAPEQGRGEKVDARCDLFSLGVVLYRAATGQQPFTGKDTVSMLLAVAMENPAPPRTINADVPEELSKLITSLLEKDPAKRPASAQAVADALREFELAADKHPPAPRKAAVAQPSPMLKPAGKRSRGWLVASIIAGFACVLLAAAGIVFFMETPNGTVRIEIMDPAIQVALDQGGFKIQGAYKDPFTVAPGDHALRIKKGDFDFDTTNFIVKKGGVTTLKIDWLDGKVKVDRDGQLSLLPPREIAPKAEKIDFAAERKAAEGLRSLGNKLRSAELRGPGGVKIVDWLPAAAELPKEPFFIANLEFAAGEVTDQDLPAIAACTQLRKLNLPGQKLGAKGVLALKTLHQLQYLNLVGSPIDDGIAEILGANPNLEQLFLGFTQVTDVGLAGLKSCPKLRELGLADKATEATSMMLADHCKELEALDSLGGFAIKLKPLKALPRLRSVRIPGELLKEEENVAAMVAMPMLEHMSLYPPMSDDRLALLKPLAGKLKHLEVNSLYGWDPGITPDGWKALDGFNELTGLALGGEKHALDGPALLRLSNLKKLTGLYVDIKSPANQKYTVDDVVAFQRKRPDVNLVVKFGDQMKDFPPREKSPPSVEPEFGEWTSLFNAKDLTGWKVNGNPRAAGDWRVENGILVGTSAKGVSYLYSEKNDYDNFQFRAKVKVNRDGIGGLCFRAAYTEEIFPGGYDAHFAPSGDKYPTGSLWGRAFSKLPVPVADSWFLYEVEAVDDRIVIKIDGKTTVDFTDPEKKYLRGHFAIECIADTPTEIHVASFEVKRLKSANPAGPIAWTAPAWGESPLDKLDPSEIPPEERFAYQPKELVAVLGSHAQRMWGGAGCPPAVSSDGTLVATGVNNSREVAIWDFATQKKKWSIAIEPQLAFGCQTHRLRFTPDGKQLIVGQHRINTSSHVYDLSGDEPRPFLYPNSPWTIGFEGTHFEILSANPVSDSKSGPFLANFKTLSDKAFTVTCYDLSKIKHGENPPEGVKEEFTGKDGRAADEAGLFFYATPDNKLVKKAFTNGKFGPQQPVAIELTNAERLGGVSADGRFLNTFNVGERKATVWDVSEMPPRKLGTIDHDPAVEFYFSPNGRWFCVSNRNRNAASFYRIETGKLGPAAEVNVPLSQFVGFSFSRDETRAASMLMAGLVQFWDLQGDTPKDLSPIDPATTVGQDAINDAYPVLHSPSGTLFVRRWDLPSSYQYWQLGDKRPQQKGMFETEGGVLRFAGAGRWLAGAKARIFKQSAEGLGDSELIPGVNGNAIQTSRDGSVAVWCRTDGDVQSLEGLDLTVRPAKKIWSLPSVKGGIYWAHRLAWFSGDNSRFVTRSQPRPDNTWDLVVWDWPGGPNAPGATEPVVRHTIARKQLTVNWERATLSHDGKKLVYHNGDAICVDDISGPKPVRVGQVPTGQAVVHLAVHPDGVHFLWCSDKGTGVFNARTMKVIWEMHGMPGSQNWAEFADDGRHIITANNNFTMYVLRVPELGAPPLKTAPTPPTAVAWSPPAWGKSPLDNLDPGEIPKDEKFDWQPKGLVGVIGRHADRMWVTQAQTVTFSPDGTLAASGGSGSLEVVIWDVATGKRKTSFQAAHFSPMPGNVSVDKIRFSPDGKKLFVGTHPFGGTHLFDLSGAEPKLEKFGIVSENQFHFLTGGPGGPLIQTWRGGPEEWTFRFHLVKGAAAEQVGGDLTLVCRSWNWRVAEAAGEIYSISKDKKLMRVRVREGKPEPAEALEIPLKEQSQIVSVSSDGRRLVLTSSGNPQEAAGPVEVWDPAASPPKLVASLPQVRRDADWIRFSPDGRWMSVQYVWTWLYRIDGKAPRHIMAPRTGGGAQDTGVAFSPDSKTMAIFTERGFLKFYRLEGDDPEKAEARELFPLDPISAFEAPHHRSEAFDSATGRLLLPRLDGPNRQFAWAPSRHQLWSLSGKRPAPAGGPNQFFDVQCNVAPASTPASGDRWLIEEIGQRMGFARFDASGLGPVTDRFLDPGPFISMSSDAALVISKSNKEGELVAHDTRVSPPKVVWTLPMGPHLLDKNMPHLRNLWIAKDKKTFLTASQSTDHTTDGPDAQPDPMAKFRIAVWNNSGAKPTLRLTVPVHSNPQIYLAAVSPDGKFLVHTRMNDDAMAIVIDDISGPTAREVNRIKVDESRISSLSFHPDSKQFLWTGIAGMGVYNIATQKHTWSWRINPGVVHAAEFADDGRHIVSYNGNSTVYIIRVPELAPTKKTENPNPATPPPAAAWQPPELGKSPLDALDAKMISAAERENHQPEELVAVIGSHTRRMWAQGQTIAFSPDGMLAATGAQRGLEVAVWDLKNGTKKWSFSAVPDAPMAVDGGVHRLRFSPDGKRLLVSMGSTTVFDISGASPVQMTDAAKKPITVPEWLFEVFADGPTVQTIVKQTWGEPGRREMTLGFRRLKSDALEAGPETTFKFQESVLVAPAAGQTFYIDPQTSKLMRLTVRNGKPAPAEEVSIDLGKNPSLIAVSSDGKRLAAVGNRYENPGNGELDLWDISASPPKKLSTVSRETTEKRPLLRLDSAFELSPDGRWLTAQYNETRLFRMDAGTAREMPEVDLTGTSGGIWQSVAFSADSKKLGMITTDGYVRFYGLDDEPRELWPFDPATAIRWPQLGNVPALDSASGRLMLPVVPSSFGLSRSQVWSLSGKGPAPARGPNHYVERWFGFVRPAFRSDPKTNPNASPDGIDRDRWLVADERGTFAFARFADLGWEAFTDPFGTPRAGTCEVSADGTLVIASRSDSTTLEAFDTTQTPAAIAWSMDLGKDSPIVSRAARQVWIARNKKCFLTLADARGPEQRLLVWDNTPGVAPAKPKLRHTIPVTYDMMGYRAALSLDNRLLLHTRNDPTVVIENISGPQPREIAKFEDMGVIEWIAPHPDGKQFVFAGSRGLAVYDVTTRRPVWTWRKGPGAVLWAEFADDGRHLVTLNANHTIYVLRLPDFGSK